MSKIEFQQLSEEEVEVFLPPETPMEMVEQIKKSLIARGLVEDLSKSTVNLRYFHLPQDNVNKIADELIKSLKGLAKDDGQYWTPKNKKLHQRKLEVSDAIKQKRANLAPQSVAKKPAPMLPQPAAPKPPETIFNPQMSGKVNYGKVKKDEDEQDVEKSGYGPKGAGLYSPADNARRKVANTGDAIADAGKNVNVKAYSSKPGQLSAKEQANALAARQKALNRKQPVKTMKDMSPQELADITARNLKKSWGKHLPFPNAEQEMEKLKSANSVQKAEDLMANQLADLMNNRAMLGQHNRQPTSEDHIMAGEQMGMGTSEQVAKSQDEAWGNTINNWLSEAVKPISQRFASEEEEMAYWNSIKIADRDNGGSGY